jgi:hypothetical protein
MYLATEVTILYNDIADTLPKDSPEYAAVELLRIRLRILNLLYGLATCTYTVLIQMQFKIISPCCHTQTIWTN